MENKIWIKLFRVKNRYYCYDVVSNNIMRISTLLYNVLKEYNYSNSTRIIQKYKNDSPAEEIEKTIQTIENFQREKGGFGFSRKIKLRFPFSRSQYKKLLHNLVNHMVLNISESCSMRCRYCKFSGAYSSARIHSTKSMDWNIIKNAIDFLVQNASYILNETDMDLVLGFYGGEPVLEIKKIEKALKYIRDNYREIFSRFRFSITTNGILLNEEIINILVDYNFTLLISLDGPPEINDRYRVLRNGGGTYRLILEKINLIKTMYPEYFEKKLGFSIVLAPEFHFKEVIDYFRDKFKGKNRVYLFSLVDDRDTDFFEAFNMKNEWRKYKKDEVCLKKKYKRARINNIDDTLLYSLFDAKISNIHRRYLHPISLELFPNGICLPGLHKVFVDTNGYFHFCEKINWKFNVGDIYDGFDTEKIFYYIEEYIKSTNDCKSCWAVRLCNECFLSSLKDDKFSRDEKESNCMLQRRRILKYMKDYVSIMEKNPEAFDEKDESVMDDIKKEAFKFLKSDLAV